MGRKIEEEKTAKKVETGERKKKKEGRREVLLSCMRGEREGKRRQRGKAR